MAKPDNIWQFPETKKQSIKPRKYIYNGKDNGIGKLWYGENISQSLHKNMQSGSKKLIILQNNTITLKTCERIFNEASKSFITKVLQGKPRDNWIAGISKRTETKVSGTDEQSHGKNFGTLLFGLKTAIKMKKRKSAELWN